MAEQDSALYLFSSEPGVRRDGTELDSPYYTDGKWVRWQRKLPRKMGGYRAMSQLANGPVRSVLVDSRNNVNSVHYFSQWGVQRQEFADDGSGGNLEDRTPFGFVRNSQYTWSQGVMYSSTGGDYAAMIAGATPDLGDLSADEVGPVYYGDMQSNMPLVPVEDGSGQILTSGGVCVLQPFLVVYGSNGLIRNSNANDFSASTGWTTGGSYFANSANVAGTKILYGAPVRGGGNSPAGLFWAVDSLIRMSFVGGANIWSYDTLTQPTSIMSKKCVVEVDGRFFWVGTDRFFFYNGVVQELPNELNTNYFFDNLNYAYRNKVWGTKVTRWGEVWWFYPRGSDTECRNAIIYNYRENTWYDAELVRSAGDSVQLFPHPVWAGAEDATETVRLEIGLTFKVTVEAAIGDTSVTVEDTTGVSGGRSFDTCFPGPSAVVSYGPTTLTFSLPLISVLPVGSAITVSQMSIPPQIGMVLRGAISGATGVVRRVTGTAINLSDPTGVFLPGEGLTAVSGVFAYATILSSNVTVEQTLESTYQHEKGTDKVVGQNVTALESYFVSRNFGFAVGAPFGEVPKTLDMMTVIERIEPDLNQVGDMRVSMLGRSFAAQPNQVMGEYDLPAGTPFLNFRNQERILSLKVSSNTVGGHYQQGHIMVRLSPGDERSSVDIE